MVMKARRQSTPQPIAAMSRLASGGKKLSQWPESLRRQQRHGIVGLALAWLWNEAMRAAFSPVLIVDLRSPACLLS